MHMKTTIWRRAVSMVLALVCLLAVPATAMAAEKTFTLIQLSETDVELERAAFQHTGEEIRPNVAVRVQDTLLTLDKDYTLEYADNIEIGTGKVIVTGIATASETLGYTGTVEIPFEITEDAPGYTLIQLKGTDVTIDGTEFTFTGEAIEPAITVTVEGKTLTAGKDYSVIYRNNIQPGTATVSVSGIATASETLGYTGTVEIDFTILPAPTEAPTEPEVTEPEATEPEVTEPEATEPEVTEPEATEPEATEPEATEPEETVPETTVPETQPVAYKVTKGNNATWHKGSAKTLSFTVDADFDLFTGLKVDGKTVPKANYTVKNGSTIVTLKSAFLQMMDTGKHTITILFEDGQAEASFRVSENLDTTNPETGDAFPLELWMALMGLSLAGGICVFVFRKKIFS